MSYLLFTPKYTRDLINLGYHDADDRIDEIEEYLFSDSGYNKTVSSSRNGKSREADMARKRSAIPIR